ncbi:MAG: hypothetical protein ACRDOI_02090, partial [Trebonia sp.]
LALPAAEPERQAGPLRPGPVLKPTSVFRPEPARAGASGQGVQGQSVRQRQGSGAPQRPRVQERSQERPRVQERSRIPVLGQDPARRAPALPPVRPVPSAVPVIPVAAPERSGLPAHARPDVAAPAAGFTPPSEFVPSASPVPSAFTPSASPVPSAPSSRPTLEVSHDGPRRRRGPAKAPSAEPVQPARPVEPVEPAQSIQPAASVEPAQLVEPVQDPADPVQSVPPVQAARSAQPTAPPPSVQAVPGPSGQQGPARPLTPRTPRIQSANPARDWPVPARPLHPVPPAAHEDTATRPDEVPPAASVAAPAAAPPVPVPPLTDEGAATRPDEALAPAAPVMPADAPAAPRRPTFEPSAPEPQAPRPQATGPRPPAPEAPAPVPGVQEVPDVKRQSVPSIERALSGPARDLNASWHGKVKIVTGNGAMPGPGARDQEAQDRNRARLPIAEPRRILILGCTSGAGQSVTALMTASMLASLREHPVAAVDLHDGTLARYRAPAAWLEELLAGKPPQHITPTRPDGLHPTPKPNPARLDVVASHEPLKDGDEIKLAVQLNRHYPLTLLDPGASGLTRLLKVTDQLVVVVPANVDAAGALADTRDWLDNNGHADLAMQSVTVINGVSRRSLPDVESAESIARGRSRAIVRVPWDDMLPVAAANPSTLRPQTRVAYTALAGVLVAGLTSTPTRKKP